jgi:hypothetical protein
MVEGDAASGSPDPRQMVRQRDADGPARRWGFVCAMARPWKTVEDQASKALVPHLPRPYSPRVRVPRLPGATGCTIFWGSRTRWCLRHSGDVTVVLSHRGRNRGPPPTQSRGTKLDEGMPRQVVGAYQRRWPVESCQSCNLRRTLFGQKFDSVDLQTALRAVCGAAAWKLTSWSWPPRGGHLPYRTASPTMQTCAST